MKLSTNWLGNALWVAAALVLPGPWIPYLLSEGPIWNSFSGAESFLHNLDNCVVNGGTLFACGAVVKLLGEIRDAKVKL